MEQALDEVARIVVLGFLLFLLSCFLYLFARRRHATLEAPGRVDGGAKLNFILLGALAVVVSGGNA